jgi:hypothetical protein
MGNFEIFPILAFSLHSLDNIIFKLILFHSVSFQFSPLTVCAMAGYRYAEHEPMHDEPAFKVD